MRRANQWRRPNDPSLDAGLVDEVYLTLAPAVVRRGEALLAGIDLRTRCVELTVHCDGLHAMHAVLTKRRQRALQRPQAHGNALFFSV